MAEDGGRMSWLNCCHVGGPISQLHRRTGPWNSVGEQSCGTPLADRLASGLAVRLPWRAPYCVGFCSELTSEEVVESHKMMERKD